MKWIEKLKKQKEDIGVDIGYLMLAKRLIKEKQSNGGISEWKKSRL